MDYFKALKLFDKQIMIKSIQKIGVKGVETINDRTYTFKFIEKRIVALNKLTDDKVYGKT